MPATLLLPAELRQHVESDLSDTALQRVLDSEEAEIVRRYGAHATASETLAGNQAIILLSRGAASVTAITETDLDGTELELETDDYRLLHGGHTLERLTTGTNAAAWWAPLVTVEYVPISQVEQRRLVLIELAKLALMYSGAASERVGDYSVQGVNYTRERERIMRRLAPLGGMAFA